MSLRVKVVLLLIVAFILIACFNYLILYRFVLPEFFALENEEANADLKRALNAIDREISELDTVCWDWSAWDDTYEFVASPSERYIASNLVLATFTDNKINLIYIVGIDGKVVWGEIYDLETEERIPLTEFPDKVFPKSQPLIAYHTDNRSLSEVNISGIMMTEKGPMLIASSPILTSSNEGPSRGFLIMGRFFDKNMVKALVDQTKVSFDVFPIHAGTLDEDENSILSRLTAQSSYLIKESEDGHLTIYTTYADIKGDPALLVKAKMPREISAKGLKTIWYATCFIIISTLVLLAAVVMFMQRTVLRPITDLTKHAISVGKTGDLSAMQNHLGKDEIGTLAKEFDNMLTNLERRASELKSVNQDLQQEIRDRKNAEESLRESELRYRSFIQNFHGVAFQWTVSGGPVFVHDAVEAVMGYTEAELLSGEPSWEQLIHPDDISKMRESLCKMMADPNSTMEMEYRAIRKDGQTRWVRAFIKACCDDSGEPVMIQGTLYDVTDQKNMESRLLQVKKMEAIGTLARGVAHEFNNILMSVVMNTEYALEKQMPGSPVYESLEASLKASYRARDLVEQILTFSREGSDELLPLNIAPIVKEVLKMFGSSLPDNIEIRSTIGAETAKVLASPRQINQVMINIFSNAEYAMRDSGGTLAVSLVEESVDPDSKPIHPDVRPGSYLKLSVSDTGEGIPPEIMDKVFEPFFTTKSPGEGPGMGLSVVHGIMKTLGGVITVRSEPGRGTVFDLFLPVIEGEEPSI